MLTNAIEKMEGELDNAESARKRVLAKLICTGGNGIERLRTPH